MRQLALVVPLMLVACDAEVVTREATQITLRANVGGSAQSSSKLRIIVSAHHGKVWETAKPQDLSVPLAKWPVDVPIVPGPGEALDSEFEVIAQALDAMGAPLAEARAITNFVPHEQRVLRLDIYPCSVAPDLTICAKLDCHGTDCLTCDHGAGCVPTPDQEGSSLDKLDPTQPIEEPIQPADAGAPDAGDVDGPDGLDAGQDAQVPACPAEPTCNAQGELETCVDGKVRVTVCPHVCLDGACTGVCKPGVDVRCADDAPLQPQVCTAEGQWAPDPAQNDGGPCDYLCENGKCGGECVANTGVKCEDNVPYSCTAASTWLAGSECTDACRKGKCDPVTSCAPGLWCVDTTSCCVSDVVPGGTFQRGYPWPDPGVDLSAHIAPFRLDRFEVTVGRFRKWLDAYDSAKPAAGAGKNPNNADDPGWDAAWNTNLVEHAPDVATALGSCENSTWRANVQDGHENLPINCVTWYEALAFCIWDGGRLPTEAEWNFAAAGGDEQRLFPWSSPPDSPAVGDKYAVYGEGSVPLEVGSRPDGAGKWGHLDLAGNLSEWTQDWLSDPYSGGGCDNCVELTSAGLGKVMRGGSWGTIEDPLNNNYRDSYFPNLREGKVGFRCAKAP